MPWLTRIQTMARECLTWLSAQPWWATIGLGLNRLSEAGTHGYPPDTKRRLMILNMIAYLIAISTLVYAIQHIFLDFERYKPVILINLSLVGFALLVPLSHRINDMAGGLIIVVAEYVALISFAALLGRSSGVQLQYAIAAAAAFVVFGLRRLWLIVPIILIGLGLHLAAWFWFPRSHAIINADREVIDSIYTQAAITTFGLISASVYYAFRLAESAKAETDLLLRSILPDNVVERLKARPGEVVADSFHDASILFADIQGFVPIARRLGAADTVELLNSVMTEFDALAVRHGVEKIKTIGDAYMAAGGVPEPHPEHLMQLARMALDMQRAMARIRDERNIELNLRIGLASGPVMAGVIGRHKFSYDVWGDAVNLAARLEALSIPGRIHICPRCKSGLQEHFEFESRGTVEIRGMGRQETWFLLGERGQGAQDPAVAAE